MGEFSTEFDWGYPKESEHLEDLSENGRIILRLIFRK
jgi:hypothetical protein